MDKEHRECYERLFGGSGCVNDGYHRGLFYLLSLLPDTRQHIKDLYDDKKDEIRIGGLDKAWQTGGSIGVTRLAFNLFSGFNGFDGDKQIEPASRYTPFELMESPLCEYFLEACWLRFEHTPQLEWQMVIEGGEDEEWEM